MTEEAQAAIGASSAAARSANPLVASISAFFPCFNDAQTIEAMVRAVTDTLADLVDDFEVIVVDDGSRDESLAVLRRLEQQLPHLRIVVHGSNRGYGGALRSGFAASTKEWIFYTDGDGQYDPAEMARLVRVVRPGVGLAQGWKLRRGDGRGRTIIGRAYHHLVARLFGLKLRDTDCDFRLLRRSVVEQAHLECDSGAICVELMYRFKQSGVECVEIPIHHFPRPYGRSQFFRLPHLARTFGELARLWMRLHGWQRTACVATGDAAAGFTPRGSLARARVAALAAIVLVSLGAHLWGFTRDLPLPDVDERYFVTPAAYMAASGDANPHWFGHPGSTIVYPLALVFRAREVVLHGAPITGAAPSIATRFKTDPGSFYLIGRLWAMLFSLAALPLVFVIGRRAFGSLVAFLATVMWAVAPLAVQYGRITRTDSVALFFALAAIWACLRALDRPSPARFAVAGVAAGLGMASRYFLFALAVLLCATWLAAWQRQRRNGDSTGDRRAEPSVRPSTIAAGFGAMAATFALTTPFFFLDWHEAMTSLDAETSTRIAFQSHGFLENVVFYFTHAIPGAISWVGLAAALVGAGLALRRPTPAKTLLLTWMLSVLVVISTLPLHWDRWVIPALPIVALFGASAVVALARAVVGRLQNADARRWAFVAVVGAAMGVMTAGPATALVALDRSQADPSTRVLARAWIERSLRPGNGVAVEIKGPDLTDSRYRYVEHFALPSAGTVADYARAGYRYLVINAGIANRYRKHPHRYRAQAAFYRFLADDTRQLADFHRDGTHGGPHLELYDLGPSRTPRETEATRDARDEQITLRPTLANHVARDTGPVPFARHGLHRLWLQDCRTATMSQQPAVTSNDHRYGLSTTRNGECSNRTE